MSSPRTTTEFLVALALWKLGRKQDALDEFAVAEQDFSSNVPPRLEIVGGNVLQNWLTCQIIRREDQTTLQTEN